MHRCRPYTVTLVCSLLLGLVVACGRETRRAETLPVIEAAPAAALLGPADVPVPSGPPERMRAAGDWRPDTLRATADAPVYGYNPFVLNTVDLFAPGTGQDAMTELRAVLAPGTTHRLPFPGGAGTPRDERVYLWRQPFPRLGDESYAVSFQSGDGGWGILVAIRRGDAVATLRHFATGALSKPVSTEDVEELARRVDERLEELVAGENDGR